MKLKKAQEATKAAKEAAKASEWASFELGVQETEIRMTEELAEVYRDYCQVVWTEALNLVGVPSALEWRKAENVYFPSDICEAPAALPPPTPLALTPLEQTPATQASLPPLEIS